MTVSFSRHSRSSHPVRRLSAADSVQSRTGTRAVTSPAVHSPVSEPRGGRHTASRARRRSDRRRPVQRSHKLGSPHLPARRRRSVTLLSVSLVSDAPAVAASLRPQTLRRRLRSSAVPSSRQAGPAPASATYRPRPHLSADTGRLAAPRPSRDRAVSCERAPAAHHVPVRRGGPVDCRR